MDLDFGDCFEGKEKNVLLLKKYGMQWIQIRALSLKDRTSLPRGLVPSNTICIGSGKGVKIYSTYQLTGITSYSN